MNILVKIRKVSFSQQLACSFRSEEIAATQMHQALAVLHQGNQKNIFKENFSSQLQQSMYNNIGIILNAYLENTKYKSLNSSQISHQFSSNLWLCTFLHIFSSQNLYTLLCFSKLHFNLCLISLDASSQTS